MIITRAPLRVSFVGGGTDLRDFYRQYPGRVLSTSIDKYVYIAVKPDMLNRFIVKYHAIEEAVHPKDLKHGRFREALLQQNIVEQGLEIASFADILARTGLGSSSSFTVALITALEAYAGRRSSKAEVAEAAARLEIEVLKEPIGKQDQYASAFGGFNIFQFNADETVEVSPIFLDYKTKVAFEDHVLLYFTGVTRAASTVLTEQRDAIHRNLDTYKAMSDSVFRFRDLLLSGDFPGLAAMLHEGWLKKKSLASSVSTSLIDILYEAGTQAGAWGGKVLGAGGGGCILFVAPPERHAAIKSALDKITGQQQLTEARTIPIKFSSSGVDILLHSS